MAGLLSYILIVLATVFAIFPTVCAVTCCHELIFGALLRRRIIKAEAARKAKYLAGSVVRREALERAEKEGWTPVNAFSKALAVHSDNVYKLVIDGAEVGRIAKKINPKWACYDELVIEGPGFCAELGLEKKLLEAVRKGDLEGAWRLGWDLGRRVFAAAIWSYRAEGNTKAMEGVFASAFALEKYLAAELGERAEKVVEEMWYKLGQLWEGPNISWIFRSLRKRGTSDEIKRLLAEVEEIKREAKNNGERINPYSRLPRELKRAVVEAYYESVRLRWRQRRKPACWPRRAAIAATA